MPDANFAIAPWLGSPRASIIVRFILDLPKPPGVAGASASARAVGSTPWFSRKGFHLHTPGAEELSLRYFPDPALRKRARDLALIDSEVRRRARVMFEIMYEHAGIGLAAPQVGWSERLFVANLSGSPEHPEQELVFVNPVLSDPQGEETIEEGCLSFRDLRVPVTRPAAIHVRATDLDGKVFELAANELLARCIQHEVDHLDGILFIQRISTVEQLKIKRALKELEKEYARR